MKKNFVICLFMIGIVLPSVFAGKKKRSKQNRTDNYSWFEKSNPCFASWLKNNKGYDEETHRKQLEKLMQIILFCARISTIHGDVVDGCKTSFGDWHEYANFFCLALFEWQATLGVLSCEMCEICKELDIDRGKLFDIYEWLCSDEWIEKKEAIKSGIRLLRSMVKKYEDGLRRKKILELAHIFLSGERGWVHLMNFIELINPSLFTEKKVREFFSGYVAERGPILLLRNFPLLPSDVDFDNPYDFMDFIAWKFYVSEGFSVAETLAATISIKRSLIKKLTEKKEQLEQSIRDLEILKLRCEQILDNNLLHANIRLGMYYEAVSRELNKRFNLGLPSNLREMSSKDIVAALDSLKTFHFMSDIGA